MKQDSSTIAYDVYRDDKIFCGIATVTLPNLSYITQTISGAGIAGNIESPILGYLEAMTLGLSFRNITKESIALSAPKIHKVDIRQSLQVEDPTNGTIDIQSIKHIFRMQPKTDNGGTIAPAAQGNGSGEYSVRYWKTVIDGDVVREIDPYNLICIIDGIDYFAKVRAALGK